MFRERKLINIKWVRPLTKRLSFSLREKACPHSRVGIGLAYFTINKHESYGWENPVT